MVSFVEGLARVSDAGDAEKAIAEYFAQRLGGGALDDAEWRRITAAIAIEFAAGSNGSSASRGRIFWERLIARGYHDYNAARDDALARGITLTAQYVAIALEVDVSHAESNTEHWDPQTIAMERHALKALLTDAFASSRTGLGIIERGAGVLALVPAQREIDASNARTAATLLPRTASKKNLNLHFLGGVGECVAAIDAHRSIEQAETAIAIGRRLYWETKDTGPQSGHVAVYDDLGVYPLLFEGADGRRLRVFAERTLAPLRAYDEKHQTELEKTLRLYFAVGQNVKTAAAELFVHRHTVFYRLRQINDICNCSLESAHDQLTLRVALAIDALAI